jgi:hypothetical protein
MNTKGQTSLGRIGILIVLTFYLLTLGIILSWSGIDATYKDTDHINNNVEDIGFKGIVQGLVSSISELPIWINTLFIILPSVLWSFILITMFIPLINPGN